MILDANVVHTTKTHYTGKHTSKLTQMHHNKSTVMALDADTGTHNIAAERGNGASIVQWYARAHTRQFTVYVAPWYGTLSAIDSGVHARGVKVA